RAQRRHQVEREIAVGDMDGAYETFDLHPRGVVDAGGRELRLWILRLRHRGGTQHLEERMHDNGRESAGCGEARHENSLSCSESFELLVRRIDVDAFVAHLQEVAVSRSVHCSEYGDHADRI